MPTKKVKKRKPPEKDYHLYPAVQVRLIPEVREILQQMTSVKGNKTSVISLALEILYENFREDAELLNGTEYYERTTSPQYTRGARQKRETPACN